MVFWDIPFCDNFAVKVHTKRSGTRGAEAAGVGGKPGTERDEPEVVFRFLLCEIAVKDEQDGGAAHIAVFAQNSRTIGK